MGLIKDLFGKKDPPFDREAFELNDQGVIGETARWFCSTYQGAVSSSNEMWEDLRNPKDLDQGIKGLEDLGELLHNYGKKSGYKGMSLIVLGDSFKINSN